MRCHYCDRSADIGITADGVTVGLCQDCFRDRLSELADADPPPELAGALDAANEAIDPPPDEADSDR